MSAPTLIAALNKKVQSEIDRRVEPKKRIPSDVYFGVVLVYGGSKGMQNPSAGDRAAQRAQGQLSPQAGEENDLWKRIRDFTYFTTGHDSSLEPGTLMFRLFPVIQEDTDN
jgi:hypothetical protein